MIKTYIIKIQSRNLTHYHRLLAVQKVSFQMILKNKVKNDPSSGSIFLSLNRYWDRLQKYCHYLPMPETMSLEGLPLKEADGVIA